MIWLFSAVNFLLLMILLGRFLRKPIVEYFRARHADVVERTAIVEARLQAAQATCVTLQQRRHGFENELTVMRRALVAAGEAERAAMLERAKRVAANTEQDVERQVAAEGARARRQVYQQTLAHAFTNVEQQLGKGLSADRQKRLLAASLSSLGSLEYFGLSPLVGGRGAEQ